MSSLYCDWCEKKRDTVMTFVEEVEEWTALCRPCAIMYHEDQIWTLKIEQNMIKAESKERAKEEEENGRPRKS